ncbi:MAG: hypothetical protein ABSA82_10205, partial [Thermacetogeniaceae bacterium]
AALTCVPVFPVCRRAFSQGGALNRRSGRALARIRAPTASCTPHSSGRAVSPDAEEAGALEPGALWARHR